MDSQKSTTIWMAIGVFIAILMGIPAWITLAYMVWIRWYPDPAQEPDLMAQAGALMTGWLPLIFVSVSSLLSALMLLVVIAKRWKNGRLKTQVRNLETDLGLEKENVKTLKQERKKAQDDLLEADKRTNEQKGMKEAVLGELAKRDSELAELQTLRDMRKEQAENIKNHVIVTRVNAGDLVLDGDAESGPCVTVELRIKNESLYNITIDPKKITGSLAFANQPLQEPILVINDAWREPIENLRPFAPAGITFQQPLRGFEVERIRSLPDGYFRLAPLRIPITTDSQTYMPPRNIRITQEFDSLPINAFRVTKSLDSNN